MHLSLLLLLALAPPVRGATPAPSAPPAPRQVEAVCARGALPELRRNPTERELRCAYGATGPGRFGLLSYVDVPVYQPATPMPGTHVVGVPGHAHPIPGESFEQWEWRVLRTEYGSEARSVHRSLDLLAPDAAERVRDLEGRLAAAGVRALRRETWRSPTRQAYLFQQGRSRPGPLATATLTSWHSQVDAAGRPAGRAVDYDVPASQMRRFHEIVAEVGLTSFGADSFDPGHVFLPDPVPERDIALLRTLPRVPEVTLSTGLPVDRELPPGGRPLLRARSEEFAATEFIPRHHPNLAGGGLSVDFITRPVDRTALHPASACKVSAKQGRRSAGGGAPCAPHRGGGQARR